LENKIAEHQLLVIKNMPGVGIVLDLKIIIAPLSSQKREAPDFHRE
jgi:hypothetical protein